MRQVLFPIKNGTITQDYYSVGNLGGQSYLLKFGTVSHAGIDIQSFHGDTICAAEDGICYKVWNLTNETLQQGLSSGFGVHLLVPLGEDIFAEYLYWHTMSNTLVKPGDKVKMGDAIAYEGDSGQVFVGGVAVPDSDKGKPPYPGTHLHFAYREVQRIKDIPQNAHLLLKDNQTPYIDSDGYYYLISDWENGNKGFTDPMKLPLIYSLPEVSVLPPTPEELANLTEQVSLIGKIVAILRKIFFGN